MNGGEERGDVSIYFHLQASGGSFVEIPPGRREAKLPLAKTKGRDQGIQSHRTQECERRSEESSRT